MGGQTGDTIALPIIISRLPNHIEVNGNIFVRKTSFHISLVCIGRLIKRHNISISNFIEKVINDFCEFVKDNDVSFLRFRDEFRFVEENERKSIVVMCDISNLDNFFDVLNEKYNLTLPYQPTHVSLFTLQPDKAIFLTDASDVKTLTRVILKPSEITL